MDLHDNDGDDVRGKEVGERGRDAFRQDQMKGQQTTHNCTLISVCGDTDCVTHWASLKNLTKLLESMARATSTANRTSGECRTWSE